jgi:hypothetical protein
MDNFTFYLIVDINGLQLYRISMRVLLMHFALNLQNDWVQAGRRKSISASGRILQDLFIRNVVVQILNIKTLLLSFRL